MFMPRLTKASLKKIIYPRWQIFDTNERVMALRCSGVSFSQRPRDSLQYPPGDFLGAPVVPFYPFSFWVPLLKPNSRKKGTLIIKGLLGNLVFGFLQRLLRGFTVL